MARSVKAIEREIATRRGQLDDLTRRAGVSRHTLIRTRERLWAETIEALDEIARELNERVAEAPPPWTAAWDSSRWNDFQPGEEDVGPLDAMRVGAVLEPGAFEPELSLDDVPALHPFLNGWGALLIATDEASRAIGRGVLQSIVLRAAVAMPAELRFTLVDPLGVGAAFPFRASLPRVRQSGRSVSEELGEVLEDILRVNQQVVGHEDRLLDLTPDQRAGEPFEIVALTDFPKAYAKDPRAVEQLVRIGNSGPRAGRHLILEVVTDQPLPHDFDYDQFENAVVIDCRHEGDAVAWDVPPEGGWQRNLLRRAVESRQHTRSGEWTSVVRPPEFFTESAARRVESPVGERLRMWLGDDDDGKPSAHCMLAGQTGSGKSFLLHVLITGLAARYSPDELRFILVDGKQGVEFEIYRDLPHAEIVCLRTSPATARSVLQDFGAEMDDRYEAFLRVGAVKLEDYRQKTGEILPRKIMVVDEYQQLLEGDPEEGGALLQRILEKGRAAGTHLILGSQTFGARGLPASALTHVHLRASLSLAQDYVQGLQAFGPEGRRLIRELAPSGQVVINDESGRDGANRRGAVARFTRTGEADPLVEVCREIAEAAGARERVPSPAIVLSGRDAAVLHDNPWVTRWRSAPPNPGELQEVARRPVRAGGFGVETWSHADRPLPLWLGRRFDVRGHALSVLRRGPAQNALVLGALADVRAMMLSLSLAALPTMTDPESLEVLLLDGLTPGLPGAGLLRTALEFLGERGARTGVAERGEEGAAIEEFVDRHFGDEEGGTTHLLVVSEPEYLAELQEGADAFTPPTTGPAGALRRALSQGPASGLHVVATASGVTTLGTILSPSREAKFFNHRIVQQMNEDESMTLFASLSAARIADHADHPHAALAVDMIRGVRAGVLFRGYAPARDVHAPRTEAALQEALARIWEDGS